MSTTTAAVLARFTDRTSAMHYAAKCIKPMRIILGTDGRFWIVNPKVANQLEAQGYEYAN